MESKLWIKLCAPLLLLIVLPVLASDDNDAPPAATVTPERPAVPGLDGDPMTPGSEPSLEESGQLNVSNNNTESSHGSSMNSTADEKAIPLIPLSNKPNGTVMDSEQFLEMNVTEDSTPKASLPVSESQTIPSITSTASSPTNRTDASSVAMPTAAPHLENTNTSQHFVPVLTDPMTTTSKPTHTTTTAPAVSQISHTTVTTAVAKPSSTSTAATSTQKSTRPPASKQNTTPSDTHSEISGESPVASTSPSAEAKARADTPSQLNVGEGVVQESPTLDPLLAGLVSAFIVTAVIITLLLFLKLRRRDNRPEFRRLQDLPMDDMMEDTPLSMYSY